MTEGSVSSGSLPPLRDVIAKYGLSARHSLGQHFLFDQNLCDRIVRCAGNLSDTTVIEVGPGPGGLTRALLRSNAKKIFAIEKDERCIQAISDLMPSAQGRLEIIAADALKTDVTALGASPRRIIANLPYNVSTVLLINWLRNATAFAGMTLMFQKEVADRLTAAPGTKAYGRLSVLCQWLCDIRREFNVDKRAFTPPPKVTSTVVTLTPLAEPRAPAKWDDLEKVTAAAFGQRRKMLRTSLRAFDLDFPALGIDPTARAETLSVDSFCAIARKISAK